MKVAVQPINLKGKPQSKRDREKTQALIGKLKVNENRVHKLGRAVTTAKLLRVTDDGEALVLPELFDVTLLWVDDKQIRLRGFEDIDGHQHAQTWDIQVL